MGDSNEEKVTCYGIIFEGSSTDRTLPGLKQWQFEYVEQYSLAHSFHLQFATSELRNSNNGLLMLIITGWRPWFLELLQYALPDIPFADILPFENTRLTTQLPVINALRSDMHFTMEHVNISLLSNSMAHEDGYHLNFGNTQVRRLPITVMTRYWTMPNRDEDRPLIVIVSESYEKISEKIIRHYNQVSGERWRRLQANQAWIYHDMNIVFTRWDRVYSTAKQLVRSRIKEIYMRQPTTSILEQFQTLHMDNTAVIDLRELLRIHKASLNVVQQGLDTIRKQRYSQYCSQTDYTGWEENETLEERFKFNAQLLEYYDVTATTLIEQQNNLLNLAFNLETVTQGHAVARLNALAFFFLPLSFVATIFGMTTFTWRAAFYPAVAFPVLVATVLFAYSANRLLFPVSKRSELMVSTATPGKMATTQSTQNLSAVDSMPAKMSVSLGGLIKSGKSRLSQLWPFSRFQKGPIAEDGIPMIPPAPSAAFGQYAPYVSQKRSQPQQQFSVQANVPNAW